jgi:cephalosporin hydroxylase
VINLLEVTDISQLTEIAFRLWKNGNLELAEWACKRVLDREPNHPTIAPLLAQIHDRQQENRLTLDAPTNYHLWYYNNQIWDTLTWMGIKILKAPSDMWNYQEIIFNLKPSLLVEFGTRFGGSALFFASLLAQLGYPHKVFSVDISHEVVSPLAKQHPAIELMLDSSISPNVALRIQQLRQQYPGRVFAILDSDHNKSHVFQEMLLLRPLLKPGDYLIVEDGNINGHPVHTHWGEGPYEAVEEYFQLYPDDYIRDIAREQKFGFTFAPGGFLIRRL